MTAAAQSAPRAAGDPRSCLRRAPAQEAGGSAEARLTVYPRIDPAVIALVTCGGYALLGRQARWAPGRFSLLAGAPLAHRKRLVCVALCACPVA